MKLDKKKILFLFFFNGISFILSYDSLLMCMTEHIASSPGREIPINVKSMHCGTCHSCVLSADDKVFASAIVTDKLRITRCCRHVYWICHGCFIVNIILCRIFVEWRTFLPFIHSLEIHWYAFVCISRLGTSCVSVNIRDMHLLFTSFVDLL